MATAGSPLAMASISTTGRFSARLGSTNRSAARISRATCVLWLLAEKGHAVGQAQLAHPGLEVGPQLAVAGDVQVRAGQFGHRLQQEPVTLLLGQRGHVEQAHPALPRAAGGSNASVSTVFGTTTRFALGATARRWPASSWLTGRHHVGVLEREPGQRSARRR